MVKARICWLLSGLAIPVLLGGCATSGLWESSTFANYHEPATPLDLHLYYSIQRKDVLVEYIEMREDETSARRRAFWMYKNLERVNARTHPRFESLEERKGLTVVPVYPNREKATSEQPADLYAILDETKNEFALYSGDRELGNFELPVYRDPYQRVKQIALTPGALIVDAAIVGGVWIMISWPYIIQALAQSRH